MARYVHAGKTIDYTPTVNVAALSVIIRGDLVCVANLDIAANTLGALTIEGVFDFDKATGGGTVITAGTKLYWDEAVRQVTVDEASGANKYIGKAVADAGNDAITVRAKLDQ